MFKTVKQPLFTGMFSIQESDGKLLRDSLFIYDKPKGRENKKGSKCAFGWAHVKQKAVDKYKCDADTHKG